jgi:uncharacterized protein (TIGR03032 family)
MSREERAMSEAVPSRQFTSETANIGTGPNEWSADLPAKWLQFEDEGGFFDLLAAADYSLCVTREYEHFVLALDGKDGKALQSAFPLPHPSGFAFDPATRELVVSSTRTPNILVWLTPYEPSAAGAEIAPDALDLDQPGTLFLPRQARYLPGTLYIHDLVRMGGDLYATITGHNFLAKVSLDRGFERVWWPKALDGLGATAFNQNYFQLNSVAPNGTPDASFYTGFSDLVTGAKPWKEGYGPKGKGVVFAGETREPILRGLTCPHSAKLDGGRLWICDSGFGTVGYVENYESLDAGTARYVPIATLPGFTRGLAFAGDLIFVGLSKVIPKYEPYAPGINSASSRCGVVAIDRRTGATVASLTWPEGYQLYDVQILPGVKNPRFPVAKREDGINPLLRFLW